MSHVSGIKFSPEQMNKLKNAMSRASQPGGASIAELQDELLGKTGTQEEDGWDSHGTNLAKGT